MRHGLGAGDAGLLHEQLGLELGLGVLLLLRAQRALGVGHHLAPDM